MKTNWSKTPYELATLWCSDANHQVSLLEKAVNDQDLAAFQTILNKLKQIGEVIHKSYLAKGKTAKPKEPPMSNAIELRRPAGCPEVSSKPGWEKTFEIRSQSSDSVYRVARNQETGQWGCSCIGYAMKKSGKPRGCKHLRSMGLQEHEIHGNARIGSGRTASKRLA